MKYKVHCEESVHSEQRQEESAGIEKENQIRYIDDRAAMAYVWLSKCN